MLIHYFLLIHIFYSILFSNVQITTSNITNLKLGITTRKGTSFIVLYLCLEKKFIIILVLKPNRYHQIFVSFPFQPKNEYILVYMHAFLLFQYQSINFF